MSMRNTSKIIRKADVTKNYSIIPNYISQSKELTPEEKSLLIHMLSMPDNWNYVKTKFWRETNLGRTRFNTAWKGLEQKGFIKSEKIIGSDNLIKGYNYTISDSQIFGVTEFRKSDVRTNRASVNPKSGKQINKQETKEVKTKERLNKDFDNSSTDATGKVAMGKSFLESFLSEYGRLPYESELLNYING
jgi:hypothetical protein